jgi:hypothetical protein
MPVQQSIDAARIEMPAPEAQFGKEIFMSPKQARAELR